MELEKGVVASEKSVVALEKGVRVRVNPQNYVRGLIRKGRGCVRKVRGLTQVYSKGSPWLALQLPDQRLEKLVVGPPRELGRKGAQGPDLHREVRRAFTSRG